MDITIREASITDYNVLSEIFSELDELHRINHPELYVKPDNIPRTPEYISELINNEDMALFVAETDSKVIGLAECRILASSDFPIFKKRKWVQLDSLAVKAEYKNCHAGSLLLKRVIEWSRQKKINRIELNVFAFNEGAVKFYSNKGFKDLSRKMYLDL